MKARSKPIYPTLTISDIENMQQFDVHAFFVERVLRTDEEQLPVMNRHWAELDWMRKYEVAKLMLPTYCHLDHVRSFITLYDGHVMTLIHLGYLELQSGYRNLGFKIAPVTIGASND